MDLIERKCRKCHTIFYKEDRKDAFYFDNPLCDDCLPPRPVEIRVKYNWTVSKDEAAIKRLPIT